jgi:hypothetical protein
MKILFPKIKVQFVVDAKGKKQHVQMSVSDFEKLITALEDYHDIATAETIKKKCSKRYPLNVVEKEIFGQAHASKR